MMPGTVHENDKKKKKHKRCLTTLGFIGSAFKIAILGNIPNATEVNET